MFLCAASRMNSHRWGREHANTEKPPELQEIPTSEAAGLPTTPHYFILLSAGPAWQQNIYDLFNSWILGMLYSWTYNPKSQCLHAIWTEIWNWNPQGRLRLCSAYARQDSVEIQQQHYFIWTLQGTHYNGNNAGRMKSWVYFNNMNINCFKKLGKSKRRERILT